MTEFSDLPKTYRFVIALIVGSGLTALTAYMVAGLFVEWTLTHRLSGFDFWAVPTKFGYLAIATQKTVVLCASGFVVLMALLFLMGAMRSVSTKYGDAKFASEGTLKREGYASVMKVGGDPDSEIVFAKFGPPKQKNACYFKPGPEVAKPHALFIAPSESGKTSGFVKPNLFRFNGSCVVLDVKGELYESTSHRRKEMGDNVWLFNPDNAKKSHSYNPLWRAAATDDLDQRWVEVLQVANTLLDTQSNSAKSFMGSAIGMFASLTMIAIKRKKPNLSEVLRLAKATKPDEYAVMAKEVGYYKARDEFLSFAQEEPKILRSYISVLNNSGLDLWRNPNVEATTRECEIKFDDLRRTPSTIYFTVPGKKVEEFTPLIRTFFYDLVNSVETKEPGSDEPFKVLILLDEFQRLGDMEKVANAYATIRSYGGRIVIISQSMSKLQKIYGHEEVRSILANAGTQMFAATDDPEARRYVSDSIGAETVLSKSRSRNLGRLDPGSTSIREEGIKLLLPEQVGRLPKDKVILLREGQMPAIANKIRYFEDPYFMPLEGQGEADIEFQPLAMASETLDRPDEPPDSSMSESDIEAAKQFEAKRSRTVEHIEIAKTVASGKSKQDAAAPRPKLSKEAKLAQIGRF